MKFLTTSFLWILAILASANDGVYYVSGNQIVPLQETDVAVTKEVLTITIGDDEFARVDVQYEFTNRGKAKSMDVGFEATGPYDPAGESRFNKAGKHPHIFDFTVEMNGQELPIRNYVIRESSEEEAADFVPLDLNVWREPTAEEDYLGNLVNRKDPDEIVNYAYAYCFKANFKEGKNVVHHTYRYRMSSAVYQSFSVPYWLKPAMRWANHQIDDFTLRIKVDKTAKQFCIENDDMWKAAQWRVAEGAGKVHTLKNEWTEYYEFSLRNGVVEWHAKNFRPTSDFTITSPENLLFYRDGDNSMKLGRYYDRSLTYLLPFEMMQETDDGARFLYGGTTDGIPNKRILRNLPYAHRGYVFKDQKLAAYFKSLWWYMPDPNWQQDTSDFTEEEWKLIREAKEE